MRDKLRYYFDSITANIDHWQPFLKMSRDALLEHVMRQI